MPHFTTFDGFISRKNIIKETELMPHSTKETDYRQQSLDNIVQSNQTLNLNPKIDAEALILPWIILAGLMLIPKSTGKSIESDSTVATDNLTNFINKQFSIEDSIYFDNNEVIKKQSTKSLPSERHSVIDGETGVIESDFDINNMAIDKKIDGLSGLAGTSYPSVINFYDDNITASTNLYSENMNDSGSCY